MSRDVPLPSTPKQCAPAVHASLAAREAYYSFLAAIVANERTVHNHEIVTWAGGGERFHNLIGIVSVLAARLLQPSAIKHQRAQREGVPARYLFPFIDVLSSRYQHAKGCSQLSAHTGAALPLWLLLVFLLGPIRLLIDSDKARLLIATRNTEARSYDNAIPCQSGCCILMQTSWQSVYINSDLMFGLFWCLGYQFSPRLAELKEARFWRMDPLADYGPLNGLARHRINTNLIATNWDDILRVAGSLKVGAIHASTLVQALQRGGHPTTLGRAIAELGRIPKTLHLLNYIDDEYYRRRILYVSWNQGYSSKISSLSDTLKYNSLPYWGTEIEAREVIFASTISKRYNLAIDHKETVTRGTMQWQIHGRRLDT